MSLAHDDAREWLRYALEDLELAAHILAQSDFVPRHRHGACDRWIST